MLHLKVFADLNIILLTDLNISELSYLERNKIVLF